MGGYQSDVLIMVKIQLDKRTLVLIVLFFFAFFVRFIFINKGPFHYDTLDLALSAQRTLDSLRLHYEHGTGYPLTVILGAFSIWTFRLFGITDPVFCVNFMSVLAGAVGVLLLFFLVEKLFDFHKAMFSAILLAVFPPHVAISTFGKSLTLGICFALASAYYMYRYTEEDQRNHLILSAVFLGFTAATRLSDCLVALPVVYLFLSSGRIDHARMRSFVVFGFIALVTAGLYYLPLLFEKGFAPWAMVLTQRQQAAFLGPFSDVSRAAFRWLLDQFWFNGSILILVGFGFMFLKKQIRPFLFLLIWFLVFQLFYGSISSSGPRYLVIAWLPLVVAQGYFLGFLKKRIFYLATAVVILMAMSDFLRYAPVLEFRHQRSLQAEYARWISNRTSPDAVIMAIDEGIFIEHYAKRKVLYRPVTCDKVLLERFLDEKLDKLLEEGKKVYIIGTALSAYDPCHLFAKKLRERYELITIGKKANEDWHHALLNREIITEWFFQIKKKGER